MIKLDGENKTIGYVFLSAVKNSDTHIGYLLGESYWGKGYATEVMQGLVTFIKSEHHVMKLIVGVDLDNLASIRLLNKLGFINHSNDNNCSMFLEYLLS